MKNAMALTLAGLLAAPSLGFAAAPDAVMVFCSAARNLARICAINDAP
ncbi:DUF4354 family protein [Pseudomonas aeruginosa]|nr:DUF4354 family protein [Pseudomonas aeruginosa]